jgi:predicted glycosyltransferase
MPMHVVAGPGMPDFEFNALKEAAAGIAGVLVEREAANLTEVLAEAAVTVSYSSCPLLDAVRTRVPALVVPCASGSDVSASRARRLAALGAIRLVEPEWLDAPTLAAQIAATVGFAPQAVDLDLSGAHATVRFLAALSEAANRFSARPVEDGARFAAIDNRSTTRLRT